MNKLLLKENFSPEEKLRKAEIVEDEGNSSGKVTLGSRVILENLDQNKVVEYFIVDSVEADPSVRKISFESPLAQALLGKREGEEMEVKVPAGVVHYRIIEIRGRDE